MFFDTDTNTYISIMILRLDSHDSFIPIQVPQFSLKYFIDPPYLSSESATWLCSEPALYLPFALPLPIVKTTFLTLLEDEIKIFFSKQRELIYSDQRYTKTKLMWPQVSILIKCQNIIKYWQHAKHINYSKWCAFPKFRFPRQPVAMEGSYLGGQNLYLL